MMLLASRAKKKRAWKEFKRIRQYFEDVFIETSPNGTMTCTSSNYTD